MSDGLTVEFRSDAIDELLADVEAMGGKAPTVMLRERAGMMGRYFASATQPVADAEASANASAVASFESGAATVVGVAVQGSVASATGDSKFARQLGLDAVRRDIRRVYIPIQVVYGEIKRKVGERVAKAYAAVVRKDPARAAELLKISGLNAQHLSFIEGFDGGTLHRKLRNRRGRINSRNQPVIITDAKALNAYIKYVEGHVGWAKSGWITAAKQIRGAKGLTKLSAFMKLPAPGIGTDRTDTVDPHVILSNGVRYAADLVSSRDIVRAQTAFEESLMQELKHICDALERKHRAALLDMLHSAV